MREQNTRLWNCLYDSSASAIAHGTEPQTETSMSIRHQERNLRALTSSANRSPGKSPRFCVSETRPGSLGHALEMPTLIRGITLSSVIVSAVIIEFPLAFERSEPKNAQVRVSHRRPSSRSGAGSETATASGRSGSTSRSVDRRQPSRCSGLVTAWGGLPHCGQVTPDTAGAWVKRNRQSGQHRCVVAEPLSAVAMATCLSALLMEANRPGSEKSLGPLSAHTPYQHPRSAPLRAGGCGCGHWANGICATYEPTGSSLWISPR